MLRIGIIGTGRIFNKHQDAILKNKNLKLVSICDNNKKKLNKISGNIKKFINIDKMMQETELDLVSICTPSGFHADNALKVLKYKIPVLVEKPIDVDYKKAKKLIKEYKAKKVKLFLVKQNRFNKTIIFLKKLIDKNKLGKINLVMSNILWCRPESYYNEDPWRGTKKLDGGVVLNQSSHYIDLLLWLFGDYTECNIMRKTLKRKIESEDTALINIFFKKKIMANVVMTTLCPFKNFEGSITIIGEKGIIKLSGSALNKFEYSDINFKKEKYNYNIKNIYGHGHHNIYKEIQKNLNNKKNNAIFADEGLKSLELINKLYKGYNNL